MAEQRIRRPIEERVAEVENKIADHKRAIEKLEAKKYNMLHPKARRKTGAGALKAIVAKAKEAGMTAEEIAAKLGVSIEE